jgi:hypothetical protein
MTPKEKAKNLVNKFYIIIPLDKMDIDYDLAKQFALIAVDEIRNSSPLEPNDIPEWLQPEDWFSEANIYAEKYWSEVKQEIENL